MPIIGTTARADSTAQSSVEFTIRTLDRLLENGAEKRPAAERIYVGCQGLSIAYLRAWRDQLAARTDRATVASSDGTIAPQSTFAAATTIDLWTDGIVYYDFDAAVTTAHRQQFLDAAAEWTAFAGVSFVQRTTQPDYVVVQNQAFPGGRADVGMQGGAQSMEIGSWNRGTLVHEIGHTLGLVHEHQRSDRDTYVTINIANIQAGQEANFMLLTDSVNVGVYDFESVMHYSKNQFANNPALNTITPNAGFEQFEDVMGNNPDRPLSTLDRAGLADATDGYGPPAVTPSRVVTNIDDSGSGSLRAAIYYAWDNPGTITFNIPGGLASGGVFTIRPTDTMTRPGPGTVIDGTTQTTFTGDTNTAGPEIVLAGDSPNAVNPINDGVVLDGLHFRDADAGVKNIVVRSFSGTGIRILGSDATNNTIAGCYIGTTHDGTAAAPNAIAGVTLEAGAHDNLVGGTSVAARNVISGNTFQGVSIKGAGTGSNTVAGNLIGLNATGSASLPNTFAGVEIFDGAANNLIGGTAAGAGNTISGNALQGVLIDGPGTSGNRIEGNAIGSNLARSAAVPNGWSGVEIAGNASANVVGGTDTGAGNLISGNSLQGVLISGAGTDANRIEGNRIGLNNAGTAALANGWSGIELGGDSTNTVIGGTLTGARNVISGNGNYGIYLHDSTGTLIQGNYIGPSTAGTLAVPNTWSGVALRGNTAGNTIGGAVHGAGNVISGNTLSGVEIAFSGSTGNLVAGNLIGLNASGTATLANGGDGVAMFTDSTDNMIGGTTPGHRNYISGNSGSGITISWAANDNHIEGNTIGLRPDGVAAGNSGAGVALWQGASGNFIGGGSGAANIISANGSDGIQLFDVATSNNRILGNHIFDNTFAGIVLITGSNGGIAPPTLTSATLTTTTSVTGSFAAPSAGTYRLEFFANLVGEFGGGEGRYFLGGSDLASGADPTPFVASLAALVPAGHIVTATVTDPVGNTSQFAANVIVTMTDTDNDGMPDAYESAHGLLPGTDDANDDADGDGQSNIAEMYAGTDPQDATDTFGPLQVVMTAAGAELTLPDAQPGKTYRFEVRDDLAGIWNVLATGLAVSTAGPITVLDTAALAKPRRFYRAAAEP